MNNKAVLVQAMAWHLVSYKCNISAWKWSNMLNICSVLWILMTWYFQIYFLQWKLLFLLMIHWSGMGRDVRIFVEGTISKVNVIFLHANDPIYWIFTQPCGYWWLVFFQIYFLHWKLLFLLTFHWRGWVGMRAFLWRAPSVKMKDPHRVITGWSSVWLSSNTGLSGTQYEQIPVTFGAWLF